jgi:hypothetical protein
MPINRYPPTVVVMAGLLPQYELSNVIALCNSAADIDTEKGVVPVVDPTSVLVPDVVVPHGGVVDVSNGVTRVSTLLPPACSPGGAGDEIEKLAHAPDFPYGGSPAKYGTLSRLLSVSVPCHSSKQYSRRSFAGLGD